MKKLLVFLLPLGMLACSQSPVSTQATTTQTVDSQLNNQTLSAYSWQLSSATDANGQPISALLLSTDKPVTLNFTDSALQVSNTCNRMSGAYQLKNNALTVKSLVSTMMFCNDALNKAEQEVSKKLEGTLKAQLQQQDNFPVLTLTTAAKDQLTLKGIATPETKYGSQAETLFLEVSADTKACSAGVMEKQCLQVREVRYNQQGIKTFVAPEWSNFYDNIEGYQHAGNMRQVLRVKKYPVKNPPADASSNAYVLDMIVESELIK